MFPDLFPAFLCKKLDDTDVLQIINSCRFCLAKCLAMGKGSTMAAPRLWPRGAGVEANGADPGPWGSQSQNTKSLGAPMSNVIGFASPRAPLRMIHCLLARVPGWLMNWLADCWLIKEWDKCKCTNTREGILRGVGFPQASLPTWVAKTLFLSSSGQNLSMAYKTSNELSLSLLNMLSSCNRKSIDTKDCAKILKLFPSLWLEKDKKQKNIYKK